MLLSALFLLPMLWLISSSLQPREQAGKVPPEWLPKLHTLTLPDASRILVTPPIEVGQHRLLVEPLEGSERGKAQLVEPSAYQDGSVTLVLQRAAGISEVRVPARLIQDVPAHFVMVKRWNLSKYASEDRTAFYADPQSVKAEFRPLFENYREALLELTANEEDRRLGMAGLMARSRLPWHPAQSPKSITFLTYLMNTLVVAFFCVFGTLASSALAAYGLSRLEWRGRNILFGITVATMMVPFPVLMVPLYGLFRGFGWIGSLYPLWVPACLGSAFNIFLLRQFFLTIPRELGEAARIDGCSELGICIRIVIPLAKPALAVVALFQFLAVWNDFLGPLIFLTRPETFTLALSLQQYQSQSGGSEWQLLMAAATLLMTPILVLFFFAQKTFISGISTTGIKG
jgi:multiple sugar transport system permease protein